ncbi:unnamed protein product [Bursaphelenchus okinawaensis]|uniref:Uncharacterized protein n=1 Tax=Bursaphelenchus okinawaensis TaxID=465554 RepID=A0A811LGN3_9BILA|nr:unnamed protein product [Bursaphelenchus okinawaensis]CAG9123483.1 unnamed protein product [Bursaphelenchus okinawaensis]
MASQKTKDDNMNRTLATIQSKKSNKNQPTAKQVAADEEGHMSSTVSMRARRTKPMETKATDHSTMSSSFSRSVSSKKASAKDSKDKKDNNQKSVMANVLDNDVLETLNCEDEEETEKRKGGHRSDNPLENGVPFWMIGSPRDQDELTDDDLLIDMVLLEEVCNKTRMLKDPFPARDKLYPFATVDQLKRNDHYFDKEMLLSITSITYYIAKTANTTKMRSDE